MTQFSDFNLPQELMASLERLGITTPTPVQAMTIPIALAGKDVLASAQTGTGKTIAYLIPLILKLAKSPHSTALILAPTRELAMQVQRALQQILGSSSSHKTTLLIGGSPMGKQISELRRRPRFIIGTPGRINDHLERETLSLESASFLVIDEADRMLDMGFGIQLDAIAEYLPEDRQTLMFSATLPPNIEKLSSRYLTNPERVSIDTSIQAAPKIKQETLRTTNADKQSQLLKALGERTGSVIVFVRTKRKADTLAQALKDNGHHAEAMHGDLPQRRRERVIQSFRANKSRILVATDVAARGLDIPHVMHVINYDLPECPEDYVHRIGRTGRREAEGFALAFICHEDGKKWKAICRLTDGAPAETGPKQPQQKDAPRQNRSPQPYRSFKERRGFNNGERRFSKERPGPGRGEKESPFGFRKSGPNQRKVGPRQFPVKHHRLSATKRSDG